MSSFKMNFIIVTLNLELVARYTRSSQPTDSIHLTSLKSGFILTKTVKVKHFQLTISSYNTSDRLLFPNINSMRNTY